MSTLLHLEVFWENVYGGDSSQAEFICQPAGVWALPWSSTAPASLLFWSFNFWWACPTALFFSDFTLGVRALWLAIFLRQTFFSALRTLRFCNGNIVWSWRGHFQISSVLLAFLLQLKVSLTSYLIKDWIWIKICLISSRYCHTLPHSLWPFSAFCADGLHTDHCSTIWDVSLTRHPLSMQLHIWRYILCRLSCLLRWSLLALSLLSVDRVVWCRFKAFLVVELIDINL